MQLHKFGSNCSFSLPKALPRMSLLEDFAKAIEQGDSNQINSLLASGSIDVNARLPRELNPPPLVFAVRCNSVDVIVETLLNAGAHIDDVSDDQQTACHVAASHGRVDALALLLAHRPSANLTLRDRSNQTPLDISFVVGQDRRVALMLVEAGAPLHARHDLCGFAVTSTRAIQALLNRGIAVKRLRRAVSMYSPLHVAAAARRTEFAVLRMLVDVCAVHLDAKTAQGSTCTAIAAFGGNLVALRLFIAAGADVNSVDTVGRTALHFVRRYECAISLLAAGADVHARDRFGETPLHSAVGAAARSIVSASVVSALLAANADLDAANQKGNTVHQLLANCHMSLDWAEIETARRDIAKEQLNFVRHRAMQVCVGLQSLGLDALQMCEILVHACGPLAPLVPFHHWWKIATTIKHFNN
jgi:ankyrin repeat protein